MYSGQDCLDNVALVDEAEEADCGGLLEVYKRLAAERNWIKMVDIARVAIMWLRGGLYLDTDMELGPRTFDHSQLYDDRCWMVQDSEGIVQVFSLLQPSPALVSSPIICLVLAVISRELLLSYELAPIGVSLKGNAPCDLMPSRSLAFA